MLADLAAWIHAVWTPWVDVALVTVVLSGMLLWAIRTADKEKARGAATRPGLESNLVRGKTMYMLEDREGEALPPPCPACGGARGTPVEPCDLCQGVGR